MLRTINNKYTANLGAMPTNETCIGQLLHYAKVKEADRAADCDKDINNYCHNGSECGRWLSDNLYYTGKSFVEDFITHTTKEDL